MNSKVWAALLAAGLGGCGKSHAEEMADQAFRDNVAEAESVAKANAARLAKASAEAIKTRPPSNDVSSDESACRAIAKSSRDCGNGGDCDPIDPLDLTRCGRFIRVNKLPKNPF